eukprot:TRINITY_DN15089_c0_g1_i1.p1 TRINITY_DN15089_c0_g1~~TRINITY_DN15089_c0_g1_i1.p1  ORF type:complete len:144 (-),score=13.45 TRINITY_DN15089_c0_g1_i1:155-553(-)
MNKFLWFLFVIFGLYRIFAVIVFDVPASFNCDFQMKDDCSSVPSYCACGLRKSLQIDLLKDYAPYDPMMASKSLQFTIICAIYAFFISPFYLLFLFAFSFRFTRISIIWSNFIFDDDRINASDTHRFCSSIH